MDDKLSDIFAFILSSDKVSVEDAEIIREFKADTDTGKTSVYQEKMGELRIKYDELFKEFSSMQQDYSRIFGHRPRTFFRLAENDEICSENQ